MKRIIKLTEGDLFKIAKKIINEEKREIEEGIFDGISDIYQGLKGVWRGEGYDFFRYLNQLKKITQDLKKLDAPNHKIMEKLKDLKNKVSNSKMPPEKKGQIIYEIDEALENFKKYSEHIDKVERLSNERLKSGGQLTSPPTQGLSPNTQQSNTGTLPQPVTPP